MHPDLSPPASKGCCVTSQAPPSTKAKPDAEALKTKVLVLDSNLACVRVQTQIVLLLATLHA